ncbi:MAG: hypothetical protein KKF79_10540, partial [Gammaproteobacteria bacterium]|nr:hypothetical protein [Gammaproteobacteria bacterium]
MLKESASLLQLYQYLDRFYQQVKSPLDGAKLPLIAEQIALQLAKLCQQQPRLAFSQLALTPVNTMYVSQLAMKQSILLSALASAGQWPSQVLEELLAANLFRLTGIVSQLSQPTLATEQHTQLSLQAGLHTLKAAGPDFQHRYWRQLLTDCSMSKHPKSSAQQVPYAAALMFCNEVSVKITPGMMKAANGLELAIQQLLQQPASAMHRYFAAQIASLGK